jgi:pre-mRNA-processing factor 6
LSSVTDEEWENIPEVGNLTREKRRREERSLVVPDSIIVGDRGKNEYESSLDSRQQEVLLSFFLYELNLMSILERWV